MTILMKPFASRPQTESDSSPDEQVSSGLLDDHGQPLASATEPEPLPWHARPVGILGQKKPEGYERLLRERAEEDRPNSDTPDGGKAHGEELVSNEKQRKGIWRFLPPGPISLRRAVAMSMGLHVVAPIAMFLSILLILFLLWAILHLPVWDWFKQKEQYRDMVFVIVPDRKMNKPDQAKRLGAHNQRAGKPEKEKPEQVTTKPAPPPKPPEVKPEVEPPKKELPPPQPQTPPEPKPPEAKTPPPEPKPKAPPPPTPAIATPKPEPQKKLKPPTNPMKTLIPKPVLDAVAPPDEPILEASTVVDPNGPVTPTEETEPLPTAAEDGQEKEAGLDVEEDADFGKFMESLEKRMKKNWVPPRGEHSRKVVVLLKVDKDGKLLEVTIEESSGDERFDRSAILASEKSSPFEPLPQEYKRQSVSVLYTFDYTVFGSSAPKRRRSTR